MAEDQPLSLDQVVDDLIVDKPEKPARPRRNGQAASSGDTTAPEGAADESGLEPEPPRDPGDLPEGGEEEIEPTEPEGEEPEGDEPDDEDPTYEVKVNGKVQEVKLSQLVANWSGETAIAARLQEATEARNAATRARDVAVEQERAAARQTIEAERTQLRQVVDNLASIYTHYGEAILTPQVQQPDPSMRVTDPVGYMTAVQAWQIERDRLAAQSQHMQEVVEQSRHLEQEQTRAYVQEQAQLILKEVPAMADETYRRAQVKRVQEVGRAVGFSDDEIRRFTTDRRTVYLGMLAAEGFEAIAKRRQPGQARVQKPTGTPAPTVRVRSMASAAAKRKAARERAKSSGDVEDVAQTLIVPAPRRRDRPQA